MKRLTILAAVAVLATSCAAPAATSPAPAPVSTTAEATPTPVVLGHGTYTWENASGAKGEMTLPGAPDPSVERLRALVKGPAVSYVSVKVDNRAGSELVNMYGVSIFTPEGEELQYKNADEYIDAIRPSDAPAEVYNQFIDLGDKLGAEAKPGAVKTFVLTGPALPKEFSRVTVYPTGGFDPVDALPAS